MRFRFIEDRRDDYPCARCAASWESPAGYYAWRHHSESDRRLANRVLLAEISRIHRDVVRTGCI